MKDSGVSEFSLLLQLAHGILSRFGRIRLSARLFRRNYRRGRGNKVSEMKRPAQLLLLAMVLERQALAASRSSCSCDCCETSASREPEFPGAMQCSFSQAGAATAPTCGSLCAKHADDATIDTAQSFLDTERFCFMECVPSHEELRAGDACRPMSFEERKSSHGAGNIRLPKPSVHFLRKKSWQTVLAREPKESKPEAPKAWASLEGTDMDKVMSEGKLAASKAEEEAKAVQQASYAGFSVVSKAARAEEDARKAAVMAMNTEEKVHQVLDMARREAHAEAFGVLKEVLPQMQQAARAAAKAKALAPASKSEEAQKKQVLATARAAGEGMKPWANAMQSAVKVRDAYASRGKELAEASLTAERNAQSLEEEARAWQTVRSPQAERKASNLHTRAQDFMATAAENDERATKYLDIAKSIDGSLPSYSQQAEQGAYHAMAMVSPDVPAPLPPLALVQKAEK